MPQGVPLRLGTSLDPNMTITSPESGAVGTRTTRPSDQQAAAGDALLLAATARGDAELGVPLGTVTTRSRAGVIALRDVTAIRLAS